MKFNKLKKFFFITILISFIFPWFVGIALAVQNHSANTSQKTDHPTNTQQQSDHPSKTQQNDFQTFIDSIKKSATAAGVSQATQQHYLDNLKPTKRLTPQEEQTLSTARHNKNLFFSAFDVDGFLANLNNVDRIDRIRSEYQINRLVLMEIYHRYRIPPGIILGLWAIESDFGRDMGNFNIIQSLAKLAYGSSRGEYFRQQLIDALVIFDKIPPTPQMLLSTFDGGMGQPQFEPESYRLYAVDFELHGYSDIWNSSPDAFASIAHFLNLNGWKAGQPWAIPIKVPANLPLNLANIHTKKPIKFWSDLGVTNLDGTALKDNQLNTSVILPHGINGPAFLAYPNFDVLLIWNRSMQEAVTVSHLAHQCECDF